MRGLENWKKSLDQLYNIQQRGSGRVLWAVQKPSHCSEWDLLPVPNDGSRAATLLPIGRLWKRLYGDESRGDEQDVQQRTTKDPTAAKLRIIDCFHSFLDLYNISFIHPKQRYERGIFRGWKLGSPKEADSRTLAARKIRASNRYLYSATTSCQLDLVRANCVVGNICTTCTASAVTADGKRQWPSKWCGKESGTVGTAGHTPPPTHERHI